MRTHTQYAHEYTQQEHMKMGICLSATNIAFVHLHIHQYMHGHVHVV